VRLADLDAAAGVRETEGDPAGVRLDPGVAALPTILLKLMHFYVLLLTPKTHFVSWHGGFYVCTLQRCNDFIIFTISFNFSYIQCTVKSPYVNHVVAPKQKCGNHLWL
jgi:hypothetical protein